MGVSDPRVKKLSDALSGTGYADRFSDEIIQNDLGLELKLGFFVDDSANGSFDRLKDHVLIGQSLERTYSLDFKRIYSCPYPGAENVDDSWELCLKIMNCARGKQERQLNLAIINTTQLVVQYLKSL